MLVADQLRGFWCIETTNDVFQKVWQTWAGHRLQMRSSRWSHRRSLARHISLFLREVKIQTCTWSTTAAWWFFIVRMKLSCARFLPRHYRAKRKTGSIPYHRTQSGTSTNSLWFSLKEYLSYCSIKKTSDHIFNIVKNLDELIRNYVKRFKVEKAKIFGCNKGIATTSFINGLRTEHPLFGELIMGEELTLASFLCFCKKACTMG